MARVQSRTPREALEMFRRTGQEDLADVLARLIESPRTPDPRAERRRRDFPPHVVDYLEAVDRRRDAARRLPPLCPFSGHEQHGLGCHDSQMAAAG